MTNKMVNGISGDDTPTSSTTNLSPCPLCGSTESLCGGLGVIRYAVPVDDERFGKLFRCPHYRVELDAERQEKLRKLSNLSAFADKTFQNFKINLSMHTPAEQKSLDFAYERSWNFAQKPDGWILLEGGYGCGKTHLAAAIGNFRLEHGDVVLFITVPDLLDHLRSAYGPSSEIGYDETFERIRNVALLILDDLGVENPSPWAQEKLFQLLNYRYSHRLPTVITTNADIDTLDQRIRSRLLDLNFVKRLTIAAPDYRSLIQNERHQLLSNLSLYKEMTFETFDARSNLLSQEQQNLQRVLRAAMSYAQTPQGWFILTGSYGAGKTHLAAAIAHYRQEHGEEVMLLTVPDLLDYLRMTYSPNAPVTFDQRFQAVRNVPFLVLDDLGTEGDKPWAKEKLFQIIDYRYVTQRPTVITTAKEIDTIDERIRSRLLDTRRCAIFAITVRSYALRQHKK
jgi:DNA replication protein DnaC